MSQNGKEEFIKLKFGSKKSRDSKNDMMQALKIRPDSRYIYIHFDLTFHSNILYSLIFKQSLPNKSHTFGRHKNLNELIHISITKYLETRIN